jgi:hypothetical protein
LGSLCFQYGELISAGTFHRDGNPPIFTLRMEPSGRFISCKLSTYKRDKWVETLSLIIYPGFSANHEKIYLRDFRNSIG